MIRVQSTCSGLVLERFSFELIYIFPERTVVSIYCGKWNTIPSNNRMNPPLMGLVVRKLQQFIWLWSSRASFSTAGASGMHQERKRLPLEFLPLSQSDFSIHPLRLSLSYLIFYRSPISISHIYPCLSVTFLLFHLLSFYRSSLLSSVFSVSAHLFSSELKLNDKLSKSST